MKGKRQQWIFSFIAGALVAAIPLGMFLLAKGHHYSEHGTFFKGALDGQQVLGVAFVEYDGLGFMELTQWKVELVKPYGQRVTLYRKSSLFQEKIPHQPKIEISGGQIHIDDGEDQMTITIQGNAKGGA